MSSVDFAPLRASSQNAMPVLRWKQTIGARSWIRLLRIPGIALFVVFGVMFLIAVSGLGDGKTVFAVLGVAFPLAIVGTLVMAWKGFGRNVTFAPSLVPLLPAFAAANGFAFDPQRVTVAYPGGLFGVGTARYAFNRISARAGRFFDIGQYHFAIPASDSSGEREWGYVAIHLGRSMPHMVLEADVPEIPGFELPFELDRSQVLALEGDFNRSFTLYCPREYETDALYFFTPDLMALCVDLAGGLHVEVVDEWMFFYAPQRFVGLSAEEYESLFALIELVGAKAVRQSSRYVDARVTDGRARHVVLSVAPQGRRLQGSGNSGLKPAALIAAVVVLIGAALVIRFVLQVLEVLS